MYTKAGTLDVGQMLLALVMLVATVLLTGVALFLIILSKLGLAILLSIAPLFIALALWKSTQGIFQAWINYLINCSMTPVLTYAFLGLILTLMEAPVAAIKQSGENLTMVATIPYLLTGTISGLLFSQVLGIAASLGGGVTLSAMGAYQKYITSPVSSVSRLAGKQISGNANRQASSRSIPKMPPPFVPSTPPIRSTTRGIK